MKVLQKIFSHGLLIAFIVAAFFLYTNRAELFPNWFNNTRTVQTEPNSGQVAVPAQPVQVAPVTSTAAPFSKTEKVARQAATEPAPVSGPEPEVVAEYRPLDAGEQVPPAEVATSSYRPLPEDEVSQVDEPVMVSPVENMHTVEESDAAVVEAAVEQASEPVSQAKPELQAAVPAPPAEPAPQTELVPQAEPVQTQESSTAPAPDSVDAESPTAEQAAAPAPAPTDVAAIGAAVDAVDDPALQQRLDEARQLYWQRDVRAAAAAYQALGHDYPRNADVWGEIGNFYFSIRQSRPASMAYYRTVSLLIDKGDTQKARQLLGVLYKLDTNRGREMDARLQQSEK